MSEQIDTRVARELESFIRENFQVDDDDELFSRDVDLWEEGYVDSVGVIETIEFLETNYSIEIPKAMLFDPEFTSVNGMSVRIAGLLNHGIANQGEDCSDALPDPA